MPVYKFRDVSEMPDHWRVPGDPTFFKAIARVWQMSHRLAPAHFPPGVHRVRSIEESNRLGDAWEAARFQEAHERRLSEDRQR